MRVLALTILAWLSLTQLTLAHPEDEFCQGVSGIDPAMCAALAEIDSAEPVRPTASTVTQNPPEPIVIERSTAETVQVYLWSGIQHIIPKGQDHIYFMMGLTLAVFFGSVIMWRRLMLQMLTFTIAHMVAMGVIGAKLMAPPASVVEPIIALSIVIVGIEGFLIRQQTSPRNNWLRIAVIFIFGLFHGAGYASVFADFNAENNFVIQDFTLSLVTFNIGVELGQLFVVAVTLAIISVIYRFIPKTENMIKLVIKLPIATFISLIGAWWFIERVWLG